MSRQLKFFSISVCSHIVILLILIVSFEFSSSMPVLQNSEKDLKIINAEILNAPPGTNPKPVAKPAPVPPPPIEKKIETPPPPKPIEKKVVMPPTPKPVTQDQAMKELLLDLKKQTAKKTPPKPKPKVDFAKTFKADAEKSLQQQMLQEQNRVTQLQSQAIRGEVDKYKALVLQAISERWVVPQTVDKKLTCELLIRVAPGGMVLDVQVAKSSGDTTLDRSARAAVFKASPLPVPVDSTAFEAFRQFVLKVKPENIV